MDFLAAPYSDYLPNLPVSLASRGRVGWAIQLFLAIRKKIPKTIGSPPTLNKRHTEVRQSVDFSDEMIASEYSSDTRWGAGKD